MIDNEAIQEELEAEQEPDGIGALEAALLAALLLSATDLYTDFDNGEGLNMNRGKRKKKFFSRITDIVANHYVNVSALVEGNAKEAFESAYEKFMETYEEELELPLIQTLTTGMVANAFEEGFPLSKTMAHNKKITTNTLHRTFQESFRQNEPLPEVTRRVSEVVRNDAQRVRTVVQEETARMQNQAQTESVAQAEEQGVNVDVIWNSMRDKKVRKAHQELNGQKADAEGWFYVDGDKAKHPHGFSKIGLNIRCRCYLEIRGVNIADSEIARELNSAASSSARREVWERRRALAKERARGDIS